MRGDEPASSSLDVICDFDGAKSSKPRLLTITV